MVVLNPQEHVGIRRAPIIVCRLSDSCLRRDCRSSIETLPRSGPAGYTNPLPLAIHPKGLLMSTATPLNLAEFIRDIPDFPKPGILFRDITPLLQSPAALAETIRQLAQPFRGQDIDLIAAAEARGFIFAAPLAL